jgi:hypothetical protein
MNLAQAVIGVTVAGIALGCGPAWMRAQERIDRGHAAAQDIRLKVWAPAGSVRLEAWERDSIQIRGTVEQGRLFAGGGHDAMKVAVENPDGASLTPVSHLVIRVPRGAQVSVKTVTGAIEATDVTGWFNSVSGSIQLRGTARRLEAESLDGDITLQAEAPWVRVRTGSGTLTIEGRYRDLLASSVSGPIRVVNKEVERGRLESVTGDIHYFGRFRAGGSVDFDSHSGTITLELPAEFVGRLDLTSVSGSIDNQLTADRPSKPATGAGQKLNLALGAGGTSITARSFKGTIRLVRM